MILCYLTHRLTAHQPDVTKNTIFTRAAAYSNKEVFNMRSSSIPAVFVFLAMSSWMMSTVMSCNCPHDCLVAYFPFEGDSTDSSGNNRDGAWSGTTSYAAGKCGQAASFDGASKIDVQSLANYAWGDEFSVSVWFQRTGQWGNYQGIVSNGYYINGGWEIRMGRESNGQMLGGSVFETAAGPWDYHNLLGAQNTWNHVAMTYDGSTLRYYLNGILQTPTNSGCCSGPIPTFNNPVTIGQAGVGTLVEYFYGLIDEVKIYGRVLPAAEVQNMALHPCL